MPAEPVPVLLGLVALAENLLFSMLDAIGIKLLTSEMIECHKALIRVVEHIFRKLKFLFIVSPDHSSDSSKPVLATASLTVSKS